MTSPVHASIRNDLEALADGARSLNGVVAGAEDSPGDAPNLDTETLVDFYHLANVSGKETVLLLQGLRTEVMARQSEGEELESGKVLFRGSGDNALEIRPRVSAKMDPEKMRVLLEQKGLVDEGSDTVIQVTDSEGLISRLTDVAANLNKKGFVWEADLIQKALTGFFSTRVSVNEKKVEKLVKTGKLDANEASAAFQIFTTHALYDVSK